jgi:hypothetical protein
MVGVPGLGVDLPSGSPDGLGGQPVLSGRCAAQRQHVHARLTKQTEEILRCARSQQAYARDLRTCWAPSQAVVPGRSCFWRDMGSRPLPEHSKHTASTARPCIPSSCNHRGEYASVELWNAPTQAIASGQGPTARRRRRSKSRLHTKNARWQIVDQARLRPNIDSLPPQNETSSSWLPNMIRTSKSMT